LLELSTNWEGRRGRARLGRTDGRAARRFRGSARPAEIDGTRPEPDLAAIHQELRRPGVTLELLPLEYLAAQPTGYRYSAFFARYRDRRARQRLTRRTAYREACVSNTIRRRVRVARAKRSNASVDRHRRRPAGIDGAAERQRPLLRRRDAARYRTLSGGTATLLTGGLAAGSHTIEARYDGDASFDAGARTATHVVNTAAATPAITPTSSRQPASTTQSMTFTATITVATSGTIAFYDGGTLLGSGSIASGRATLTAAGLTAGSHAITARFQGNASAPPVISAVLVQSITSSGWKDRTSTVALVSSANPSALGTTVTFTATASGTSGTPTGRLLFMVDGLVTGDPTGIAMTSGQASVAVPALNGGRHKVTATYLGNSNYRGSTGALTQTVN
jgi:hypothetical protein